MDCKRFLFLKKLFFADFKILFWRILAKHFAVWYTFYVAYIL